MVSCRICGAGDMSEKFTFCPHCAARLDPQSAQGGAGVGSSGAKATKRKENEIDQAMQNTLQSSQSRIDDVTTHLSDLETADQKLAPAIGPDTLTQQVKACCKEEQKFLIQTRGTVRPPINMPAVSRDDGRQMQQFPGGVSPLTGPGSEPYFVTGARVVRGSDWLVLLDSDGRGSGTVTEVEEYQDGLKVHVSWDKTGRTQGYFVGVNGRYQLQLLPTQE